MQTFVLAPQGSKKYYVHNDIFRYQVSNKHFKKPANHVISCYDNYVNLDYIFILQDEVFSDTDGGTSGATTNLRASDRGQENVDERGHLLDSTSPNIVS